MWKKQTRAEGYSLVEVILAMGIFSMLALGLTRGLVFSRAIAETNIREVTADAAASGYLEQLKSMEYGIILKSVEDSSIPLPTVLNLGDPDPVYLAKWVTKEIVIDEDPDTGNVRKMPFYIRIEIDDLEASGEGDLLAIAVYFAWEDAKTGRRHDRALRTMRSHVPTF